MSSTPDQILQALVGLIDDRIRHALASAPVAGANYSQLDTQRPPGVGRTRYLRAWRRGRDAGDPEVYADGRARVMTAAAWQRHGASTPTRSRVRHAAVTRDVDVLRELGLAAPKRCG